VGSSSVYWVAGYGELDWMVGVMMKWKGLRRDCGCLYMIEVGTIPALVSLISPIFSIILRRNSPTPSLLRHVAFKFHRSLHTSLPIVLSFGLGIDSMSIFTSWSTEYEKIFSSTLIEELVGQVTVLSSLSLK
jgi:hypothetical protein